MAKPTILLVDNDLQFLEIRGEVLKREGYHIISTDDPSEALRLVEQGDIDLVILDIRLQNDEDENDISGITLAKEMPRLIPKIILTYYPNWYRVRDVFKIQLDGLPDAVEFVSKHDGLDPLISAIQRGLKLDTWLRKVKQAIDGTDNDVIMKDHDITLRQSKVTYWIAIIAACIGAIIIFWGTVLVSSKQLEVSIVSAISGTIMEVIGYLFYKRLDIANKRMDDYHKERIEGQRFQTLLQACNGFDSEDERESIKKQIIITATQSWLVLSKKANITSDKAMRLKKNDKSK